MAFERLSARRARNREIYGPHALTEMLRVRRTALIPTRACGFAGAIVGLLSTAVSGPARTVALVVAIGLLLASLVLLVPYVRAMARETRRLREKRRAWEREHPDR